MSRALPTVIIPAPNYARLEHSLGQLGVISIQMPFFFFQRFAGPVLSTRRFAATKS